MLCCIVVVVYRTSACPRKTNEETRKSKPPRRTKRELLRAGHLFANFQVVAWRISNSDMPAAMLGCFAKHLRTCHNAKESLPVSLMKSAQRVLKIIPATHCTKVSRQKLQNSISRPDSQEKRLGQAAICPKPESQELATKAILNVGSQCFRLSLSGVFEYTTFPRTWAPELKSATQPSSWMQGT